MKKGLACLALALMLLSLASCWNGRLSQAEMKHKLDSIARIENVEWLKAQGIDLERDVSPVQVFYDSLNIQSLPIRYSDDYVKYLPGYKAVSHEMAMYLSLEGRTRPKAIALPETVGVRLIIFAADEGDGLYSLWLYSLDEEYMPVDKLCLYAINPDEAKENLIASPEDRLIQDFVVTSDYEIRLTDYSGKYEAEVQKVYHIDPSRHFSEDDEIDYDKEKPLY